MGISVVLKNLVFAAGAFLFTSQPTFAQQTRQIPSKPNDPTFDQIVEDFIQFDIGNVRDPALAERYRARFNALRAEEAVPALVRGLNRATRMRYSCPITEISGKLKSILHETQNSDVGTYVLRNLELRDVGQYNHHIRGLHDSAEKQVMRVKTKSGAEHALKRKGQEDQQRMAYVPGMKLTDLAIRDSAATRAGTDDRKNGGASGPGDLGKSSVAELFRKLGEGPSQAVLLNELHRRASQGEDKEIIKQSEAFLKCLKEGDDAAQESAARLLGLIRCQQAVPQLIDALENSHTQVRSAAATALARITRQLFGPGDTATPEERKQAVARWREWWSRQAKNPE